MPDNAPADRPDHLVPASDRADGEAPETFNPEQEDEDSQAQSVAGGAWARTGPGLDDTEKVSSGDESDGVQDLVDHLRQMDSSGIIDMSAYAGERNDDEEEGRYGNAAEEE